MRQAWPSFPNYAPTDGAQRSQSPAPENARDQPGAGIM
jgi:hypothetical protein